MLKLILKLYFLLRTPTAFSIGPLVAGVLGGSMSLAFIAFVILLCVYIWRLYSNIVSGELKVNSSAFNVLHVTVLYKTTPSNSNVLRAPSDHYPALVIAWFRVLLYLETAHKFSEAWHQ